MTDQELPPAAADEPAADEPATDTAPAELEPIELRTLEVRPGENLEGHVLRMRFPSARFLIAQRRGVASDVEYWEEILDAIEEHDLGQDPDRLPAREVNLIGIAWTRALREAAVPPA
jgi:hypothetical protein